MTFTSSGFLPFLAAVLVLTVLTPQRFRWVPLLLASFAFYATWRVPYLLLVLAVLTMGSYASALAIERQEDEGRKRTFFWLGMSLALGLLVGLRYLGFLSANVEAIARLVGADPLPWRVGPFAAIGVSYFVLTAIAYLVDVRDGAVAAERNLGRFALHLAFFPKLIQGPIERPEHLLPQLERLPGLDTTGLVPGAKLFLWGLFQKVVVADRLAPMVDRVYSNVGAYEGLPLLVATWLFAAQLYFDFAGYTDMALGVGRLFGVQLTPNFRAPYAATSIQDFWRRWHISFSSWLLDYVFRPLQATLRDLRTWGTPIALFVTFTVSGLWHGPTWGFVAWGVLHGAYLAAGVVKRPVAARVRRALRLEGTRTLKVLQVAMTFQLVCFAWIFFRARSLEEGLHVAVHGLSGLPGSLALLARGEDVSTQLRLGEPPGRFAFALAVIALGTALPWALRAAGEASSAWWSRLARTAAYAAVFYMIVFLGAATQSFVYEQF